MTDSIHLWLESEENSVAAAQSLANTLYQYPVDILLNGDLGTGKTLFVQSLAKELGITEPITSPTYALEHVYTTVNNVPFTHIDLYRIDQNQSDEFLMQSENHTGIRCIEWAARSTLNSNCITITLDDSCERGRNLTIDFKDDPVPSSSEIHELQEYYRLPNHIREHCEAVASVSRTIADHFLQNNIIVRKQHLNAAARLHDLLRFVDFDQKQSHLHPDSAENDAFWNEQKKEFPNMRHEEACSILMHKKGYNIVADIIEPHGCMIPAPKRNIIEQLLLYYSDKRVMFDSIVTIDERFEDFKKRYTDGKSTEKSEVMLKEAKDIEKLLFPNGPPF